MEGCAAGGESDAAAVGVELDAADAVELAQGPFGGQVLVCEVGVADVGFGEGVADEGLDDGGVDADGDVAADSFLGPVAHGPQVQEVFEGPEAGFDACELAVGGHHLGGAGLCGCEAGGEHVAAGEELLVLHGVFVVVVDEPACCDLDVEEPPGAAGAEDALRGSADFGGVFEPAVADAALQRQQLGLRGGGDLGGALRVAAGAGVGFDDYGAGPVGEGDVRGSAAVLPDLGPGGVAVDGREGLRGSAVSAQPGCEHVVEPGAGHCFDVGGRDEAPVSDHADAAHREPLGEVGQHRRQGGGVAGAAGEHMVRDRDPVSGAQQPDHDLGPV